VIDVSPTGEPLPPHHEILNLEQAADYLGVSSKTFQKVLREGEMPGRKVGREWKFSRRALETWIANSKSRDFLDAADRDGEPQTPVRRAQAAAASAASSSANGGGARVAPLKSSKTFEAEED
jgi:excisionase family DNA binding protein